MSNLIYDNARVYACPMCERETNISLTLVNDSLKRIRYQYSCVCGYKTKPGRTIAEVREMLDTAI